MTDGLHPNPESLARGSHRKDDYGRHGTPPRLRTVSSVVCSSVWTFAIRWTCSSQLLCDAQLTNDGTFGDCCHMPYFFVEHLTAKTWYVYGLGANLLFGYSTCFVAVANCVIVVPSRQVSFCLCTICLTFQLPTELEA